MRLGNASDLPADKWDNVIVATASLCILIFTVTLYWMGQNIKWFLIDQKRCGNFSLMAFYILGCVLLGTRILQFLNAITVFAHHLKWLPRFLLLPFIYNFCLVVAMWTRVMLGFAQLESMTTLNLKLLKDPNYDYKVRRNRILIWATNTTVFAWMCFFTVDFMIVTHFESSQCLPDPECSSYRYAHFLRFLDNVSLVYYSLVSLSLIVQFFRFNQSMKKILKGEKDDAVVSKAVKDLFFIIATAYTLRTLLLKFVGQKYLLVTMQLLVWTFFDVLTVIPPIVMHRKSF